jgi:hypothetical protein
MQRPEVGAAVRPIYGSLGVKGLTQISVVTSRSDLESKGEGKKNSEKKGVKAGLPKFFQKHRSDLKILCAKRWHETSYIVRTYKY